MLGPPATNEWSAVAVSDGIARTRRPSLTVATKSSLSSHIACVVVKCRKHSFRAAAKPPPPGPNPSGRGNAAVGGREAIGTRPPPELVQLKRGTELPHVCGCAVARPCVQHNDLVEERKRLEKLPELREVGARDDCPAERFRINNHGRDPLGAEGYQPLAMRMPI